MSEAGAASDGASRAAVLLMAIGAERASEVLKHLEPRQVQALGSAMASVGDVTQSQLGEVLKGFMSTVRDISSLGVGSHDYLRTVLTQALGPDRASSVLPRILNGTRSHGIDSLNWMAAQDIAEILGKEHPQIIALALLNLEADTAADVLALLGEDLRGDVMVRVATLDGVHPSALKELDAILEAQLGATVDLKLPGFGGTKAAADILNAVPSDLEAELLDRLNDSDPDLKSTIQEQMFNFESIGGLDDRGFQAVLREVSSDSLILALKGASPRICERIFKNMSARAAEMLRDDLESKGPVRLSEVEAAQKEILSVVNRLVEEGTVVMQGKGEEFL
jgi:flagellar motor switch protein FliG